MATRLSKWSRLFPLTVESKQLNQLITGWIEKQKSNGQFRFKLRKHSDRNVYIQETILCVVNAIAELNEFKRDNTFCVLLETKKSVYVTLYGDNDFYSQVKTLQDAKLPLCRDSLRSLEAFLPPTIKEHGGEKVALKTGLGSSAALVTSLVAALVAFFVPSIRFQERQKDLELVHNLAQLSHCYVQRKIGSGFDVSAACFGSQIYTRFPVSILNAFTSEDAMKPKEMIRCITDHELWDTSSRVKSLRLPSAFHLMMGDVSTGSATVSMVRQVLDWQTSQPDHAQRIMDAIDRHNMEIEKGFAEVGKLEACLSTPFDYEAIAGLNCNQWSTMNGKIGAALLRIREAYACIRELMREMGTLAGVPIEPPEQTAILDATLAIPGVLLAGVPGAGGYDAICVIVIHASVLQIVEDLWVQWTSTHPNHVICPLLCDIDHGLAISSPVKSGLQVHSCLERKSSLQIREEMMSKQCLSRLQMAVTSNQSNEQNVSKRKIREEDGVERDRIVKASYVPCNNEELGRMEQEQHEGFLIDGLRFATESWTGMKSSNEDRHAFSVDVFPGPVFGIFDGHGGTFSADFLSRRLIKTTASVIRQGMGENAFFDLRCSQLQSSREKLRKDALIEQATLLRQQLAQVETMRSDTAVESSDDELRILVEQLHGTLLQMDSEMKQIDAEEAARREKRRQWYNRQHTCFVKSFKDAFERVDALILQKNPSQDGSTALLVWFLADSVDAVDENKKKDKPQPHELSFYTVNVGDCRAVMCRGGRGVLLTSDHKPDRADEKQRIENAGGFVGKIGGISRVYSSAGAGLSMQREASTYLAVSRAFGDRSLKTPTSLVSCEPEVTRYHVHTEDLFLVLACDGIWDVLSEQDVVDIALPHFHDAKAATNAIVKTAYKKGSVDNLTATVIQFGWKSDGQLQQAIDNSKVMKASSLKENTTAEEEIDMFNL
ncbi:unnamed protein product [Peronospora belbahrii]|uniref:phosphomevalonate kinase n=1 Tax=Peronospora belbahrii TaxID=622444 RepID=A0AAU9KYA4_9STRA|nr:unnamed protein product [Peronospora belbahrii]CAH0515342.1 unnamed protein product [Peronospora belbahrii]